MRNQGGFTLIEILVAVAVFSVLASMAHLGLSTLIGQNEELQARAEQFDRLNQSLQLLEMDLLQALPRSGRDGLGGVVPAFRVQRNAAVTLEFTRAGTGAPLEGGISRIRYRYQQGVLSRQVDSVLDGAADPKRAYPMQLLSGLEGFEVEMLDVAGRPVAEKEQGSVAEANLALLPAAIRLRLDTAGWGSLERTLLVGG